MPISKKQNKSRKHFSRINKNKTKLRKNLNDKKSKKTKLQISKLSGGAGRAVRAGMFNNKTLNEKFKLINNNMSNISKFEKVELSDIENKITNTEKEILKIKRIIKSNRTRNNPEYKEESGYDKYKIYLNILKGYKKLKTPQSGFSKIFRASPKPPVAPRKKRTQNVERNSESPINAWKEEEYENLHTQNENIYHNSSAPGEQLHPPIPQPFSEYVIFEENKTKFGNEPEEKVPQRRNIIFSKNSNPLLASAPAPAPEIEYIGNSNNNTFETNPVNNKDIYAVPNSSIVRLKNFIKSLKNISFCDCKIILLYILSYKLYINEEQKQNIITLIKQEPVSSTEINNLGNPIPNIKNINLIKNVIEIVKFIINDYNIITPKNVSCSKIDFKAFLDKDNNKINYKILFNTKSDKMYDIIVQTLLTIFERGGIFIKKDIDIEKMVMDINPFHIFMKPSKNQSLNLGQGDKQSLSLVQGEEYENYELEEEEEEA